MKRQPIRLRAPDRRRQILRVAGELFARHGYAGTRLEDIATEAGVSKPVLYRHFESKRALYLALLEQHRADLPAFLEGADSLESILEGWLDYVRGHGHAWKLLFRDSSGDETIRAFRLEVSGRAREVLAGLLAESVAERQLQASAEALRSALAGLALWWIEHPDAAKQDVLEVALRVSRAAAALPR